MPLQGGKRVITALDSAPRYSPEGSEMRSIIANKTDEKISHLPGDRSEAWTRIIETTAKQGGKKNGGQHPACAARASIIRRSKPSEEARSPRAGVRPC